jgi:hypothetical protein
VAVGPHSSSCGPRLLESAVLDPWWRRAAEGSDTQQSSCCGPLAHQPLSGGVDRGGVGMCSAWAAEEPEPVVADIYTGPVDVDLEATYHIGAPSFSQLKG